VNCGSGSRPFGRVCAQGNFTVTEGDIPRLKLNHYFTADKRPHDADFSWTFTKTSFTIKKEKGPIPSHIVGMLLPAGITADEITGNWTLQGRRLNLTKIRAGNSEGKKDVSLPIFKTAAVIVRICDPEQCVFQIAEK